MTYCFLDLETTGLDPEKDQILEIGWVFTDETFKPLGEGSSYLIDQDWAKTWDRLHWAKTSFVKDMHTSNGLLAELANPDSMTYDIDEVWFDLRDQIIGYAPAGLIHLAGRSVHFDKSFLLANGFEELFDDSQPVSFYHRLLDLSAVKLFLETVGIDTKQFEVATDQPHRALDDVQNDIGWAVNAAQYMAELESVSL